MFTAFSLCEFDPTQVSQYVQNWFNLDESVQADRRHDLIRSFIADSAFVNDLRVNPLMLSLMCGIYASENYIPRNRPDVYEKCALLLFESWDKQRGIKVSLSFDAHVQAAMRSLALWLYPQQVSEQGMPKEKLINYMKGYLLKKRFDDEEEAENAATEFINFCKGRAWVLTDVGSDLYGFTHRTFLEYFAASQIVRENVEPGKLFDFLVERLRSGGWEVVAQLALQILNKSKEDGADDFLEILLAYIKTDIEMSLKLKLLSFAAQSLTYIVPKPPVLQAMITCIVDAYRMYYWNAADKDRDILEPLELLLGASTENLPLVSKYLYEYIGELLSADCLDSSALALGLYTDVFATSDISRGSYTTGNNARFWLEQAGLNAGRFMGAAESQWRLNEWVAVYLLEKGHRSATEVLTHHNPKILFEMSAASSLYGILNPLALRIFLTESPARRSRSCTSMSGSQIEELKEALVGLSLPGFTVGPQPGLQGFVHFAIHELLLDAGAVRTYSNSAMLLLLAAIYDLTEEPLSGRSDLRNRRLQPVRDSGTVALRRILGEREFLIRDSKGSHFSAGVQSALFSAGEVLSIQRTLVEAGVDDRTTALLEQWATNPAFRIAIVKSTEGRSGRRMTAGKRSLRVGDGKKHGSSGRKS
jgi:hypothetical protein